MSLKDCIKKAGNATVLVGGNKIRWLNDNDKAFLERELADGKSDEQALQALDQAVAAEIDLLVGQIEALGIEMDTQEVGDRKAIDAEADKKWAKWKPDVTSTGKVMGAPGWVNRSDDPAAALRKLERELRNRLREGETGRYWYEESARRIMDLVNNDIVLAEKFIQIIAIYSPQADVQGNTGFAVKAWNQWKNNEPIDVKTGNQDAKATDVLYNNKPYAGRKTNSFYQNLMYELVAQNPKAKMILSLDQEIIDTLDKPATIDLWMFRAFGFDNESAGDDKGGGAYSFSENYLRRITARLNLQRAPGDPRWTPHQVQAAIWSAMKARYETKWVKDSTNRESVRKGYSIRQGKNKFTRKSGAENKRKHNAIWRKWAMKVTAAEAKLAAETTSASYETFLDQMTQSLSWEVMPAADLKLDINNASPEVKRQFMREALAVLIDSDGSDMLAKQLGLPLNYVRTGIGAWKGEVNQNVMSHLLPTKAEGEFDFAQAQAYAQAIQYIFKQAVVPVMRTDPRPFNSQKARDAQKYRVIKPDGKTLARSVTDDRDKALAMAEAKGEGYYAKGGPMSRGTTFTFRDNLTEEQLENVVKSLSEIFEDVGFSQVAPNQIAIVNYRNDNGIPELSDEAFVEAMEEVLPALEDMGAIKAQTFWSQSNENQKANWADPETGERLIVSGSLEGRPDLQAWIRDRGQAFEEVIERYSGQRLRERELESRDVEHLSQLTGYHASSIEEFEGGRMSTDYVGSSVGTGMFNFGWGLYFSSVPEGGERYRVQFEELRGVPGSLWQADMQIEEHELLDWDRPLGRQDPRMVRLLDNIAEGGHQYYDNLGFTAGDFYKMLAKNLPGGDKEASLTLLDFGIKGIRFQTPGRPDWKAPEFNYVVFDDTLIDEIDRLKQVSVYYSALTRAAKGLKQNKGTGQQMLQLIKKSPGVKPEEIDWLGLEEFLGDRRGVTKQEVIDFVEQGGVRVDEVLLGADSRLPRLMEDEARPAGDAIDILTDEYVDWAVGEGFTEDETGDATEMLMRDDITQEQRRWLNDFIDRWEAAQEIQDTLLQAEAARATDPGGYSVIPQVPEAGVPFFVEGWRYQYMPNGTITDGDQTWQNFYDFTSQWVNDEADQTAMNELHGAIRHWVYNDVFIDEITEENREDEDEELGFRWVTDADMGETFATRREAEQDVWDEMESMQSDIGDPDDSYDEAATAPQPSEQAPDTPRAGPARWSEYALPGGQNYRELLLTFPDTSRGAFNSGHWPITNILANIRFNEREVNGERVLFIEEIQSDWHQKGRKLGYQGVPATPAKVREILLKEFGQQGEAQFEIWGPTLVDYFNETDESKRGDLVIDGGWREQDVERLHKAAREYRISNIADAPFKKTWPMLAMKRMIRWAAENNFDRVSWTTGEQQLDRWPQKRKRINKARVTPLRGNRWSLQGFSGSSMIEERTVTYDVLEMLLGEDLARQGVNGPPGRQDQIEELNASMMVLDDRIKEIILPLQPNDQDEMTWMINAIQAVRDGRQSTFRELGDSQWRDLIYHVEERDSIFSEWVELDSGATMLENIEVDLGARSMIGFYDEMLVTNTNKYLKKYKSRVQSAPLRDPRTTVRRQRRAPPPSDNQLTVVTTPTAGAVSNITGEILDGQLPWASNEIGRVIFSSETAVDSFFDAVRAGDIETTAQDGDLRLANARSFLGGAPEIIPIAEAEERTGMELDPTDDPDAMGVIYPGGFHAAYYPPGTEEGGEEGRYEAIIDRDVFGSSSLEEAEQIWGAYMAMWIDSEGIDEDVHTFYMTVPNDRDDWRTGAQAAWLESLENGDIDRAVDERGGRVTWEERGSFGMYHTPAFMSEVQDSVPAIFDLITDFQLDWENAEILDQVSPDEFLLRLPITYETSDGYFRGNILIDADTNKEAGDQADIRGESLDESEEIPPPVDRYEVPADIIQQVRAERAPELGEEVYFWDQATAEPYPLEDYRDDVDRNQADYMDYRVPVLTLVDTEYRYGWLDIAVRDGQVVHQWISEDIGEDQMLSHLYMLYMRGTEMFETGTPESIEALNEFAEMADAHYNLTRDHGLQPENEYADMWGMIMEAVSQRPAPVDEEQEAQTFSGTITGLNEAQLSNIQTAVAEAVEETANDMGVAENYVWDNFADIGQDDDGNIRFDGITQVWMDLLNAELEAAPTAQLQMDEATEQAQADAEMAALGAAIGIQPTAQRQAIPGMIRAEFEDQYGDGYRHVYWEDAYIIDGPDANGFATWVVLTEMPGGYVTQTQLRIGADDTWSRTMFTRNPFDISPADLDIAIRQFASGAMSMQEFNEEFGADILTDDNWDDILGENEQELADPGTYLSAVNRVVRRAEEVERQEMAGPGTAPAAPTGPMVEPVPPANDAFWRNRLDDEDWLGATVWPAVEEYTAGNITDEEFMEEIDMMRGMAPAMPDLETGNANAMDSEQFNYIVQGNYENIVNWLGEVRQGTADLTGVNMYQPPARPEYEEITTVERPEDIPQVHSFPVTQELREMAMEGQALFQEREETERGRYYPDLSGERIIQLLNASDLSTFLHESSHFFLDMQMVWAKKYRIMTPTQVAILEWLGVNRFEDITREHHERWAETFEVYLMDGKSPSQKLRRAFAAYKKWLKVIYRQLGLEDPRLQRAQLDDQAREIFDRLLATEDEIEIAAETPEFRAMYQSLEESGMTEQGWAEYQARAARAKETAEIDIDEQVMKEYKRMKSTQWRQEKKPLIEEEKQRLQAEPIYQLMSDLTVVKDENGEVVSDARMDWHALREAVGEIPRGKWIGKAVGGGIDPAQYAEAYGFASVQDMYNKVNNAPTLNQAADQAAEGRMIQKYGDILRDGSLEQEVREAMLNEDQAQLVLMELRSARKSEGWMGELGQRPQTKINRQLMKAEAEEIIGDMVYKQIRPTKYYNAMIKYAQKAARGEDTTQSKLMQLSNHYLYKAALEIKERMTKDRAKIRAVQTRQYKAVDVAPEYIEAMKMLALAYDLRTNPEERIRYTNAVLDFYEGQRQDPETGLDNIAMMDPQLALAYAYRQEHKTLDGYALPTFDELKADDLNGIVQMLEHLRFVGGGIAGEGKADVQTLREQGMQSIEENGGKDYKIQRDAPPRDSDEMRLTISNLFHSLTSIPNMIRRLDGFKDGGWAAEHILKPLSDAYGRALTLQREMHDRLDDHMGNVSRVGLSRRDATEYQTEAGETVAFSSEAKFMMALYWGTESSRQAIMDGHNLTENDVMGMLRTLTPEQLELVNAVWAMNESRWPMLQEATKKRFGVAPPKLKPTPFMVNGVQMTGGHMQLFYDSRRVELSQERQNAMRNAAVVPARAGSTIARVGSGGAPVLLDIHNITRSVDDAVQMIAFSETGKYLADILNNKAFAAQIEKKHGPEFYRNLVEAIDAVTANNVHVESNKGWAKLSRWMRGNATMMILAYSIRNVTQQLGALPLAIEEVNPLRFAQASSVMLQDPKGMATTINSFSPFMQNRAQLVNREAREYMRKMMATSKGRAMWEGFKSRGFMLQTMVDATIAYPTWWAKYQKGMDDHGDHDRAVIEADRAVGESVGSGSDLHLGRIMQGNQGEFVKTLTVFGSWFNAYHQRLYRSSKGFTSFLNARFFMDGILLPIIVANISQALILDTPDEEEEWYEWAAQNTFDFLIGTLPGFRDIAAQVKGYSPTAPLYNLFSAPVKLGQTVGTFMEGDTSKVKLVEDVGRTLSSIRALPGSGNIWRSLDYIDSYMQGNEEGDFNPYQMLVEGADKNQ